MWISKKQYKDIHERINDLLESITNLEVDVKCQQECINQLKSMHDLKINEYYSSDQGSFYRFNRMFHEEPKTTIGDIGNLTFTELAEYVINGKPITRIREHEVVVCPKEE